MPNKRLPEGERKNKVGLRLPQWMIDEIKEIGTIQTVIEGILRKHIKKKDKQDKH